jgi:concentrative nucleoside transporter, CNT family
MLSQFMGLIGILVILGICWLISSNRSAIQLRIVLWGLGLQWVFALIVLKTDLGQRTFDLMGRAVNRLLGFAVEGSKFVFGSLGDRANGNAFYFAFQVLPTIIFIAAFFAVLYHLGVMQRLVRLMAIIMAKLMGASGAESLNVAASIFMGQTEAPLTIRPYLGGMTRSELMTVMTSGMAHISGGIMAAYIAFGIDAKHLISAVIMTAPGTILLAKILIPETETPQTGAHVPLVREKIDANVIAAAARGTTEGMHLAMNVAAMLISFLAFIAMINYVLGYAHTSLQGLLGYLFSPLAWLMGVSWKDAPTIGSLLGSRLVLNELVAYSQLGPLKEALDPKSFTIATYALCGFANISSVGIQIGGIGALAPERRSDLARLGLRALMAGTLANFLSACIAGVLL